MMTIKKKHVFIFYQDICGQTYCDIFFFTQFFLFSVYEEKHSNIYITYHDIALSKLWLIH